MDAAVVCVKTSDSSVCGTPRHGLSCMTRSAHAAGNAQAASEVGEVLCAFGLQKLCRPPKLVETIHPVLDRDPPIETNLCQQPEDGVVVVHPFAGLTMLQDRGVAGGTIRRAQ